MKKILLVVLTFLWFMVSTGYSQENSPKQKSDMSKTDSVRSVKHTTSVIPDSVRAKYKKPVTLPPPVQDSIPGKNYPDTIGIKPKN